MYLYTAPPGTPTGATAVQSGPTSVSVSWTALSSGGPVTRYDIYYVANGAPSTSGGSTNSTCYVQYNISVIAVDTSLHIEMSKKSAWQYVATIRYMLCTFPNLHSLLVVINTSDKLRDNFLAF